MPKKVKEQVSILADGVAHVREVPEGVTADEITQQFWVERAERAKAAPIEGRALDNAKKGRLPERQRVNALDILEG